LQRAFGRPGLDGTTPAVRAEAATVATQASGAAHSALSGLSGPLTAALEEFHNQEEQAATWLRWGTVLVSVLVLLVLGLIAAWFFAPVRTAIAGVL
jgi:hypothetical protein